MSKKKTIQISDSVQLVIEATKMGDSGEPFVRIQQFYSTKADPETFLPGRQGVSIPFKHRIKVTKALKAIHDAATEDESNIKVLEGRTVQKGGKPAAKKVVKKAPRKPDW